MLGKRPRTMMKRTSSVSLIGSGAGKEDGQRLPEHPKEKQKSPCNCSPGRAGLTAPVAAAAPPPPRQVIGFHPKAFVAEQPLLEASQQQQHPVAASSSPLRSSRGSSPPLPPGKSSSPGGSPRSGLGDLLAGARPWERKQAAAGVGLSIVAALSDGTTPTPELGKGCSPADLPRKAPTTAFAPARASPPIPIAALPPPASNSGFARPVHCPRPTGGSNPIAPVPSPTARRPHDAAFLASGGCGRAARPVAAPPAASSWSWSQQADMEVDRAEPLVAMMPLPAPPPPVVQLMHSAPVASFGFAQNFLDSCHLCRRQIGEGRDIYIYRGDKAFCSPECRHQQILIDERPEKCSSVVMKARGADSRSTNQRSRVIAAGAAA